MRLLLLLLNSIIFAYVIFFWQRKRKKAVANLSPTSTQRGPSTTGGTAAAGVVSALSAALVDTTGSCTVDKADEVRSAVGYAAACSTETLPITTVPQSALGGVRRAEAKRLMEGYPYAVCMPLADRNLLEIIQSERLAEEPVAVIRAAGLKVASLIQSSKWPLRWRKSDRSTWMVIRRTAARR